MRAARAATALGELGAVEALPALQARTGLFAGLTLRRACRDTIARLEPLSQLPRPCDASEVAMDQLPRAATSIPSTETLPRTSPE